MPLLVETPQVVPVGAHSISRQGTEEEMSIPGNIDKIMLLILQAFAELSQASREQAHRTEEKFEKAYKASAQGNISLANTAVLVALASLGVRALANFYVQPDPEGKYGYADLVRFGSEHFIPQAGGLVTGSQQTAKDKANFKAQLHLGQVNNASATQNEQQTVTTAQEIQRSLRDTMSAAARGS